MICIATFSDPMDHAFFSDFDEATALKQYLSRFDISDNVVLFKVPDGVSRSRFSQFIPYKVLTKRALEKLYRLWFMQ